MKLYILALVFIFQFALNNVLAQKYQNTQHNAISKSYDGNTFTSENTLLENLTEANGFSVYASMLENHSEALFTEDFMGTVFVISDAGFERFKEENENLDFSEVSYQKAQLQYLIVPGRLDAHSIKKAVVKGGGTARFSTLLGTTLEIKMSGDSLYLQSSDNEKAQVLATDFYHKHGFFHIVNRVVIPEISKD